MSKLHARLEALAHMLPTLSDAENRLLIQLTLMAGESDHVQAGQRPLAALMHCSRSTVQETIKAALLHGHIVELAGNRTNSTVFTLRLGGVKSIGGPDFGPRTGRTEVAQGGPTAGPPLLESAEIFSTGGPKSGPGVDLKEGLGGPDSGPPQQPAEAVQTTFAGAQRARVDSDSETTDRSIERILAAKAEDFEPSLIAEARSTLHGHMRKFGDPQCNAPDDAILAQFLAVAKWEGRAGLLELVYDLRAERAEPGETYGWFVAVAAQRLRGIKPQVLKARRDELRQQRRKKPQSAGLQHAGSTAAEIARRI